MKNINLIIACIVVIVLIAGGIIYFSGSPKQDGEIKTCKDIKGDIELTFEMSYCQGDMCGVTCDKQGNNCHSVTSKEECESIDVVTENLKAGKDGKPDCGWIEGRDPLDSCKPNK